MLAPARDRCCPCVRQLAQHRRGVLAHPRRAWCRASPSPACASGQCSSRTRPARETLGSQCGSVGLAADLVQRQQPMEAVERRVLDRLRHQRPGQLLQARSTVAAGPRRSSAQAVLEAGQGGRAGRGPLAAPARSNASASTPDRSRSRSSRHRCGRPGRPPEGVAERRPPSPSASAERRDRRASAASSPANSSLPAPRPWPPRRCRRSPRRSVKRSPARPARPAPAGDEQAQDLVHELVAGGAGHRPVRWQPLVADQDLLDQT